MKTIVSKHDSNIAYCDMADPTVKERLADAFGPNDNKPTYPIVIRPGVNKVTPEQLHALSADQKFVQHAKDGFIVDGDAVPHEADRPRQAKQEAPAPAPAPAKASAPQADALPEGPLTEEQIAAARVQQQGEKKAAYTARMKKLDERIAAEKAQADNAAFLDGWFAMSPEDQEAMKATLTEEQVAADPRSQAKE